LRNFMWNWFCIKICWSIQWWCGIWGRNL